MPSKKRVATLRARIRRERAAERRQARETIEIKTGLIVCLARLAAEKEM